LSIPACTYHNDDDYPQPPTDQQTKNSLPATHSTLTPTHPTARAHLSHSSVPLILGLPLARTRRLPCPEALKPRPQIGSPHTEPYPFVYSPCSPHTPLAALPNCPPCPAHSLSADGCALGDAPGLNLRRRAFLYTNTLNKAFFAGPPVRGGLEADSTSVTYHLHPTFEFWSSEDGDKDDNFATLT